MESPIEKSRRGVESDLENTFRGPRFNESDSLVAAGSILSTQFDRQADEVTAPAIPAGGGSAAGPFSVVDASTTSGTPAAKISVNYGVLYVPGLGTNIDVTMGGTSLTLSPTLTLSAAGTYTIYMAVDLGANTATIQSTTGTVPSDVPASNLTYIILAIVTVIVVGSGFGCSTIMLGISNSLVVSFCAGSNTFFWSSI